MNGRTWSAVVTSAVLSMACSGGGSSTSSNDLVGTWNIAKYELVSTSNPATKVDLIALGASSMVLLKADGSYQMKMKMAGQPDQDTSGTWSASTDVLTTTQVGMSGNMQFNYSLSGSTLTLSGADSEWDFDGDDIREPAKLSIIAVRR